MRCDLSSCGAPRDRALAASADCTRGRCDCAPCGFPCMAASSRLREASGPMRDGGEGSDVGCMSMSRKREREECGVGGEGWPVEWGMDRLGLGVSLGCIDFGLLV
jgi:hypothetical protein